MTNEKKRYKELMDIHPGDWTDKDYDIVDKYSEKLVTAEIVDGKYIMKNNK